jgi:hypothetical protein
VVPVPVVVVVVAGGGGTTTLMRVTHVMCTPLSAVEQMIEPVPGLLLSPV